MAFDPPTLPPTQPSWLQFQIWWQGVVDSLKAQEDAQDELIASLSEAVDAITAAQDAADAANAAAAAADASAAAAQSTADSITETNELATSYVSGVTITATDVGSDVTIAISAHTRHYPQPDGSTVDVAVSGASLTGKAYSTRYFITYTDPSRAGGAVSYSATTTEPAQIGDLHVVGSVLTPAAAAGPTGGSGVRPPGSGSIAYA